MSSQTTNTDDSSAKVKSQIKGMRSELKKVIWPTKKEVVNYTVAVIAMCTAIAIIVWIIDSGLNRILRLILG